MNKQMPLLTDGKNKSLFVVSVSVEERKRTIQAEHKDEFDKLKLEISEINGSKEMLEKAKIIEEKRRREEESQRKKKSRD